MTANHSGDSIADEVPPIFFYDGHFWEAYFFQGWKDPWKTYLAGIAFLALQYLKTNPTSNCHKMEYPTYTTYKHKTFHASAKI